MQGMKKIMFNSKYGLDKAVLEGRKTMTRRIINPQPAYDKLKGVYWKGGYYGIGFNNPNDAYKNFISGTEHDKSCNRYRVGEVIAIARPYKDIVDFDNIKEILRLHDTAGWNNKMFVKANRMEYFIKITGVRVERLQDITSEDCLKEGVEEHLKGVQYGFPSNIGYVGQYPFSTPREAFAGLIDRVSGKGMWESNPWVWVYEFELTDNPNKS